jgi:hypothetical protein
MNCRRLLLRMKSTFCRKSGKSSPLLVQNHVARTAIHVLSHQCAAPRRSATTRSLRARERRRGTSGATSPPRKSCLESAVTTGVEAQPPAQSLRFVQHTQSKGESACSLVSYDSLLTCPQCDESGPPCKACVGLEIPCTFNRPSRRRGPPNKHAEAIKKRRVGEAESAGSSPQSPIHAAHALQSSHPAQLSAEEICALPTLNALIDDFFTYIHPLCPFPHEPSFRDAWAQREDLSNPSFLALLASMIAALVSSFPRKPRLHLTTQTRREYPSHLALVDKCWEVCARARGPGYLDRPNLNVYDACTSYFLGLAGAYVFKWRQLRLYLAESLTIIRSLGLHKAEAQGYTHLGGVPSAWGSNGPSYDGSRESKVDYITEEIGRRVFWTVFVGAR